MENKITKTLDNYKDDPKKSKTTQKLKSVPSISNNDLVIPSQQQKHIYKPVYSIK